MACPELKGLRLSPKGQEALREIQRVKELSDALATVMAAGMVVNIFAGSNALTSSYNIYEADWQELSQAMRRIPDIKRRLIWNIAGLQAEIHPFGDEGKFWRALTDGCRD